MSFELLGTINKVRRKSNRGYDALSPVYELLLNAINAERNNEAVDKNVIINIEYNTEKLNDTDKKERINYIKISDFGVGFNETQFASFKNLNSTINQKLGCRGMGRFQIMRSFHKIRIESFNGNERFWFDLAECNTKDNDVEGFSEKNKISNNELISTEVSKETIVECFYNVNISNNKFDDAIPIKAIDEEEIKERINSKLLLKLALLKKDGFDIQIKFQGKDFITNHNIVDLSGTDKKFSVDGIVGDFTIYHLETDEIRNKTNETKNYVVYVADSIEVDKDSSFFKDKPHSLYKDNDDKRYIGIVESEYLNKYVSDDRTEFYIDNAKFDSIKASCNNEIKTHLASQLESYYEDRKKRLNNVMEKYPFLKDKSITIDYKPDDTEEEIAEKGYIDSVKNEFKSFNKLEVKIKEFADILKKKDYKEQVKQANLFAEQDRESKLKEKAHAIADEIPLVKKHILSRTVSEEYTILKQIEECINQEGAEHYIHDIVFPRFNIETKARGIEVSNKTSDEARKAYDKANLWLIDDKYIGYNYQYLASEFQIKDFDERMLQASDIKEKYKESRPDICVFQENENDNIEPVVVIEFKAQSSNKKVNEAVEQTKDYAKIISSISENKYSRFTLLIVQPIEEIKSATDYLNSEDWAVLKQEHHYIKTYTIKDYNKKEISIASEVISLRRFAELARKRKERYMKDLGLL